LKEEQAFRPNAGCAAKPWQDLFGDDRLDEKQMHRRKNDRRRVYENAEYIAVPGTA
jgi:hypothetical protein